MVRVSLDSVHSFRKQNGVTQFDSKGQYDRMKCSACGIEGKCRDFVSVLVDGRSRIKAERCTQTKEKVEKESADLEYQYAYQTDIPCPKCKSKLRQSAEWMLEGTNEVAYMDAICKCGYKKHLMDVRKKKVKQ